MRRYKLGMVAAEFNFEVTSLMIERAKAEAEFLEVDIAKTIMVPGVFEVPLAAKKLVSDPDIDAVITLGAVIEGETDHDQVVVGQASGGSWTCPPSSTSPSRSASPDPA